MLAKLWLDQKPILAEILESFEQDNIGEETWQDALRKLVTMPDDVKAQLRKKYEEPLMLLEKGEYVDCSLGNGLVRSSKEIMRQEDGTFTIYHGISDHFEDFSEAGLFEMWEGLRSPWDGDLTTAETNEPTDGDSEEDDDE